MTENFPSLGVVTPKRALRARVVALVTTVALLFGAFSALAATPAVAATSPHSVATTTPAPTTTPEATEDDAEGNGSEVALTGDISVTLSPLAQGMFTPGASLTTWTYIANGTDSALADATITLSIGDAALNDRAALATWLDTGDGATHEESNTLQVLGTTTTTVASGEAGAAGIITTADNTLLAERSAGVYPLLAEVTSAGQTVVATSVITVPDTTTSATVGVVVPITAATNDGGLLSTAQLSALTGAEGELTIQLDAVEGTAAILAVDPAIAAAIRVLGSSAPASATAWLQRLEQLPNSRFALQFADADIAAQLDAGLTEPLEPLPLTAYMDPVNFTAPAPSPTATSETPPTGTAASSPRPTPTPTPTSSPNIDEDATTALPDMESLLNVGRTQPGIYWPVTGTADTSTLQSLSALSTEDNTATTLVGSATAESDHATVTAAASIAGTSALVYDSDISTALTAASTIDDPAERGASLAAASAYLSFAAAEASGAPLLAVIDRASDRSRLGLQAATSALSNVAGVSAASLSTLLAAAPTERQLADVDSEATRVAVVKEGQAAAARVGDFSTILTDPVLVTGPQRARELQLLSAQWIGSDEWAAVRESYAQSTQGVLSSVSILPPSDVNLLTSGADLGFWVKNDLPYPVTVILRSTPDDLRLKVEEMTIVEADASSNTRAQVLVEARIANGEVSIDLALESPTGVPIGKDEVFTVNVRAEWEGIGIVVLVVLIGGLLVFGAVRTVLRRRARRAAPVESDASAEASLDE